MLDEVNFMSRVDRSLRAAEGGEFDQALALYNALVRRRESRYLRGGKLPGILCLASSKRYEGQFTDLKEREAKDEARIRGKSRIYIFDRCVWEVKPDSEYSGEVFGVFVGDYLRNPRILDDGETVPEADAKLVKMVPVEFRRSFEANIVQSVRDIAGVSTRALNPFFVDSDPILERSGGRRPACSTGKKWSSRPTGASSKSFRRSSETCGGPGSPTSISASRRTAPGWPWGTWPESWKRL